MDHSRRSPTPATHSGHRRGASSSSPTKNFTQYSKPRTRWGIYPDIDADGRELNFGIGCSVDVDVFRGVGVCTQRFDRRWIKHCARGVPLELLTPHLLLLLPENLKVQVQVLGASSSQGAPASSRPAHKRPTCGAREGTGARGKHSFAGPPRRRC